MSTTEILAELPNLSPEELGIVLQKAMDLHQGQVLDASPELLAAIDEADASLATEGTISSEEMRRTVASWFTK